MLRGRLQGREEKENVNCELKCINMREKCSNGCKCEHEALENCRNGCKGKMVH